MKKKLLILLITLLFPILVHAEDTFTEYYGLDVIVSDYNVYENNIVNYSNEIIYENGHYQLSGTVVMINLTPNLIRYYFPDSEYLYTCGSSKSTTCETVTMIDYNTECSGNGNGFLGVILRDGQTAEDKKYFYVGKDYKENNGLYTLENYEKHPISELTATSYLSNHYGGYYFCPTSFGITCDNMVVLSYRSHRISAAESVENWHYLGDGYQYIDDKFNLLNPKKTMLASTSGGHGYTCISKESICDQLYYVEISESYDSHDGGRAYTYSKVIIPNEIKKETAQLYLGDTKVIEEYFSLDEINSIIITNPSIIEIKNGKIITKSVGETYLIYEDNDTYKEIKISIIEEKKEINENPKTNMNIHILLMIVSNILLLFSMLFFFKKLKKT